MEIKLNSEKYLTKISKRDVVKNLFDFNLGSVVTDIVGVDLDIEMKAFLLLFNSSRETNLQLSKTYGQKQLDNEYNLVSISKSIEKEYKDFLEQDVILTKDFFENILTIRNDYLYTSFKLFGSFCDKLEIKLPTDIRNKYYILYRECLVNEYHNNKERYQELEDFFKNPISSQNDKIIKLLENYTKLKQYYTTPLQQNSLTKETLQDLYIEPYFSIYKNNVLNAEDYRNGDFFQFSNQDSVNDFFNDYFLIGKKHESIKQDYDMVFILGQPGQGKTSFCYKLIFDYIENNNGIPKVPIIFQKIRDLVAKDFINNPFETINKYNSILNFEEDEFILVLDGLDEAYMSGGITDNDLRNLYDRLKKRSNKKIRIILTSRFNFLNVNDACLDDTLILQLNELTDNQIKDYCKKFKKFYPKNSLTKNINSILGTKKYEHIKELLRQAVLIYFIAISDIEIEEKDSKSKIYDKIFDSLAQRSWDSNGQLDYINPKLKSNPALYKSFLREYIRSIAFEIYHSPKLYITVNKLLDLDSTKLFIKRCFNDNVSEAEDKIKEFSKYLLVSFYFQQTNKDTEDTALEFFHNSLWEYLTAEYMWEENKNLLLRENRYRELEIVKEEDYFEFLDKLAGQKKINEFSVEMNLKEIIFNENEDVKQKIFEQSEDIFYKLLDNDFLLKFNFERGGLTSSEKATEHFNVFWCFLHESNVSNNIFLYSKGFQYLFQKNRFVTEKLKNVKITDSSLSNIFVIENTFENVEFYHSSLIAEMDTNHFEKIIFNRCYISRSLFDNNELYKVSFIDCEFSHYVYFNDNIFNDLVMNNVQIDGNEWFDDFVENNSFDINFLEKHFVEERIEKDYRGEEVRNFYVMYRDLETVSEELYVERKGI
ncbi:NACHT domain-containing protein [Chryseobacterium indoltheticum]|uniref:NACHT domain-containing protein n=1 Tax=Chryseobacterium indoltheticum TaxID=254 RepID=UPI0028EA6435|nr:NACHT domain-containing protein [Chryseobacterium indoltheticum]